MNWTAKRMWYGVASTNCEFWDSKRGIVFGNVWYEGNRDSGAYITYDAGETWEHWRMVSGWTGVLIADSVLYYLGRWGYDPAYRTWERRGYGYLKRHYRKYPYDNAQLLLREHITALSSAGTKVYLLLLDGRLLTYDHATDAADPPALPDAAGFTIAPNPTRGAMTIQRAGPRGTLLVFDLYDAAGRRVPGASDLTMQAWEERRTVDLGALPPGVYHIVQRGDAAQCRSVTLVK